MVYYSSTLPAIRLHGVNRILYDFDNILSILSKYWNLKISYSLDPQDVLSESEGKSFIIFEGIPKRFSKLHGGCAYFVVISRFIRAWKKKCRAHFVSHQHLKEFEFERLNNVINRARVRFGNEMKIDEVNCTVGKFFEFLGESIIESFESVVQKISKGGTRIWNIL